MSQKDANLDPADYTISITGKHIEVTKPIRDYIEEKLHKIEHITSGIIDVYVVIEVQKIHHSCSIVMKFSHFKIKVMADTGDMYATIDKAITRLATKIRRWKTKIQDHHAKGVSVTEMEVNVYEKLAHEAEDIEQDIVDKNNAKVDERYAMPAVTKKLTRAMKTLRFDEAVMKMELSHDHFLIFRSEEDQKLKVMYKLPDASYAVISPE